jgi:hypothetical protein
LGIERNLVEKRYSFKFNIKVCLQRFGEVAGLIGRTKERLSRKKTTKSIKYLGAEI